MTMRSPRCFISARSGTRTFLGAVEVMIAFLRCSTSRPPKLPPTIATRGYARVWGFSFADRDTISVRHCSVLFSHLFLKRLTVEISENLRSSRRPRWSGQRYVFSAEGAASMPAWGSAPGSLMDCERALKARLIDLGFGMNRAFSADGFVIITDPGAAAPG